MSSPQNLSQSINVQPSAVVSKEIVSRPSGTITLFAFDKDQGLSEHTAPFDAFVQALDGQSNITISGETFIINSGESILMPANSPHSLKATTPFKMLLTMIRS